MWSNNRGISLMETLFSLFLCALILGALASTLTSAGSISRNRQEMDQAIEVFHVLSLMSTDASAALAMLSPAPHSSGPTLSLLRVNPRLGFADRTVASAGGNELDPYELSECIEVLYQVEEGMLVRTTTIPGQPVSREPLIGCAELRVSRIGVAGTLLDIELTLSGQRVAKKRRIRVCLR